MYHIRYLSTSLYLFLSLSLSLSFSPPLSLSFSLSFFLSFSLSLSLSLSFSSNFLLISPSIFFTIIEDPLSIAMVKNPIPQCLANSFLIVCVNTSQLIREKSCLYTYQTSPNNVSHASGYCNNISYNEISIAVLVWR
jgi:hypothetical protein